MHLRSLLASALVLQLVFAPLPRIAQAADQDGSTPRTARGRDVTTAQSAGSVDVMAGTASGAATLSFPIEVAPGTNGVQPAVVLGYSSLSRASSWVGKGWGMGFGAIERSTKRGVPRYDATDTYVLNGEELLPESSGSVRYETRRKSFARIRRCADSELASPVCAGITPAAAVAWVVEQPDGTVQRYGLSPDARIDTPKGAAKWLLSEVYDPDGNVIVYRYSSEDTGQRYPSEIRYTLRRSGGPRGALSSLGGNEANDRVVRFILQNREDPRLSYAGGYEERTTKRLAQIQVEVQSGNGRRILRQYDLTYAPSWDNRASLLTKIEQRGLDGQGEPLVTTFAYTTNDPARCGRVGAAPCAPASDPSAPLFTNATGAPYSLPAAVSFTTDDRLDGGVRIADVNADGRPDLMRAFLDEQMPGASAANGAYLNLSTAPTGFVHQPNLRLPPVPVTFNTTREGAFSILGRFSGANLITARQDGFLLADFTGDGRPDLLRAMDFTSLSTCRAETPLGRARVREFYVGTPAGFEPRPAPDIADFALGFQGVTQRPGDPGDPPRFPAFSVARGGSLAELNGDGLPDLTQIELLTVFYPRDRVSGASFIADAWLNRGGGAFAMASRSALNVCETLPLPCASVETRSAQVDLVCTSAPAQSVVSGGEPAGKRYLDVNGDGLDDFVSSLRDGEIMQRRVVLNEGAQFGNLAASERATGEFGLPMGLFLDESVQGVFRDRGIRLFDVNGDGILDIVQATEDPAVPSRTWLGTQIVGEPYVERPERRAVPASMMFTLANGLDRGVRDMDFDADGVADLIRLDATLGGGQAFWRNDAVVPDLMVQVTNPLQGVQTFTYRPSTDQPNPNLHLNVQTVSEVKRHDPFNLPDLDVVTRFEYRQGMYDTAEREFRGFRTVIASNVIGVRTVTLTHQNVILQGQPFERYIETNEGEKMQRELFKYAGEGGAMEPPFPVQLVEQTTESYGDPDPELGSDYDPNQALRVVTRMRYDSRGNVTRIEQQQPESAHDVGTPATRIQTFEYTRPKDDTAYITNRVARVRKLGADGSTILEEALNTYDGNASEDLFAPPTLGRLTRSVVRALEDEGTDLATSFEYDEYGNVTERSGPGPQVMRIEYGAAGLFSFPTRMEVDADDDTTLSMAIAYTFSLCETPLPLGAGLPHFETDANGNITARCYDGRARPTLVSQPFADPTRGPITRFRYTDFKSVFEPATVKTERLNDALEPVSTTVTMDGFGRPRSTLSDGQGGIQVVSFMLRNALDQVTAMALPDDLGAARRLFTFLTYDRLGRVVRTTAPGDRITQSVEVRGKLSVTDPNGNVRVSIADGFGDVRRVLEYPEGPVGASVATSYEYDHASRLVRIQPAPPGPGEPEVGETEIEYNSLGQRTLLSDPDLGTVTSTYGAAGNLASETDARDATTYFEYDAVSRLVRSGTQLDEDGALVPDQILTYDEGAADENGLGNLTSVQEDPDTPEARTHRFSYDELGRRIGEEHVIAGKRFLFAQTFDRLGALESRSFPGLSDDALLARLEISYDAQGFASEIRETVSETLLAHDFAFDTRSRVTGFTTDNGVRTTTEFNLDTDLLERMALTKTGEPSVAESLRYRLDSGGRVRAITDETVGSRSRTFEYDALNRLTSSTGPWGPSTPPTTLAFAYDTYGNLTEKDGLTRTYGGESVPPHAIAALDDQAFEYDASGNLTAIKSGDASTRGYVWNERGQLEAVRGASGGDLATYLYDQSGRRIRAKEGATTRWFITDDFEWDQTAKQATIYVTGPGGRLASFTQPFDPPVAKSAVVAWLDQNVRAQGVLAGLIVLPLLLLLGLCVRSVATTHRARLRPVLATATVAAFWLGLCLPSVAYPAARPAPATLPELRFFHSDQLGSTTLQTDATGAIVLRTLYRPFGEAQVDPAELPPFAFNGQRFEKGVGLYDYGARFYDPALGRFLSPDPVIPEPGDPQSLNRYSYVLNNPTNLVDPSGNIPILIPLLIVGGGGLINAGIDAYRGEINTFGDFAKSFTVGAASTGAGLLTANPIAGGAAGGAVGSITESALNGEAPALEDVVQSAALGAVGGKVGQQLGKGLARVLPGTRNATAAQAAAGEALEDTAKVAARGTPGQRLAARAQRLPASKRPNTVAVLRSRDGRLVVGRNRGGVTNPEVDAALAEIPPNEFGGACAEANCLARALNKGVDARGATIEVLNVRGPSSTTGVQGTLKRPCSVCAPLLDRFGVRAQ